MWCYFVVSQTSGSMRYLRNIFIYIFCTSQGLLAVNYLALKIWKMISSFNTHPTQWMQPMCPSNVFYGPHPISIQSFLSKVHTNKWHKWKELIKIRASLDGTAFSDKSRGFVRFDRSKYLCEWLRLRHQGVCPVFGRYLTRGELDDLYFRCLYRQI